MSSSEVLILAFLIGVIAGLRALTAPAAVAVGGIWPRNPQSHTTQVLWEASCRHCFHGAGFA